MAAEIAEEDQPARAQQHADQRVQSNRRLGVSDIFSLQRMRDHGSGKRLQRGREQDAEVGPVERPVDETNAAERRVVG